MKVGTNEEGGSCAYLVGEGRCPLKVLVELRRDEVVELSNKTIALCFVVAIALGVPGADLTETLGIGLAKVR